MNKLVKLGCRPYWKNFKRLVPVNRAELFVQNQIKTDILVRFNHDDPSYVNPYKQQENEYYHSFLSRNKKYVGSIAFLDYAPELEPPKDVNSALGEHFDEQYGLKLMVYLYAVLKHSQENQEILNDRRFETLCTTLSSKIGSMNEDHVLNLLKVLTLWDESKRSSIFFNLCRSIDKVFLQRYKLWGYDRCLLVMDHFYRLRVLRFSEVVWSCMKRLWRNPERLTSSQVVHAMFLVNAHRIWHPAVHLYNLECYLQNTVYELGVEECAILALAFFKTENRIKNVKLLKLFHEKLMYRVSNIDSIPLAAFLKLFRFCGYYTMEEQTRQLLCALNSIVDKHSYLCCTHMALLGTGLLVRNHELLDKIAARFVKEISTIRVKDIERTLLAFETFNYASKDEPDVYQVALNELIKRKDDVFQYSTPFYSAVTYLALRGYYNFDLCDYLLKENIIKKAFKRKELSRYNCNISLLTISNGIKIDFPGYSGSLVSDSLKEQFYLWQGSKILENTDRRLANYDKILYLARSLLHEIFGGEDFVHYTYVLPHLSRPDLVFRLKGNVPVKLPENVLSKNYLDIELPSKTEDWYVVTCVGFNTALYGTDIPIGNTLTKFRHLNKIGYKILCIKELEWQKKSKDGRIEYLRELLKNAQNLIQPEVQQPIRVELR